MNFIIFSGEKDDAVGPGSYEINLPELWRKTGTCWSKYLCEKEPLKKRPNSGNESNDNKLINHTKLDKCYNKIVKKKISVDENEKKSALLNEQKNLLMDLQKKEGELKQARMKQAELLMAVIEKDREYMKALLRRNYLLGRKMTLNRAFNS